MSSIYSRIELGPQGEIRGQIFAADAPHVIRTLEILLDDQICGTVICDLPGVNGGKNGFEITLPLRQMRFAPNARLSFRDKASGERLDRPRPVPEAWRALELRDPSISGYVENVTEDGRVTGWVWAPAAPAERLVITLMVDDQPVMSSTASFDRADLREAGIGDGKYGFDCTLPWELIANQRQSRVSVRATPMLIPFGKTVLLRRDQGSKLEDRLAAAEAELKRVKAEFTATREALAQAGLAARTQLFSTIGAFFTELAQSAAKGEIPALASRRGLSLADFTARFPRLRLDPPAEPPEARILIPALGSIETLVGAIEAVHKSGADRRAEVMIFDDGSIEEAVLLPAVLRHLRVLRLLPGEEAGRLRGEALLGGAAPVLILLAPPARVEGAWLDLLLAALAEENVAVAGGGLLREDGMFHSTGLVLGGGAGRMQDLGAGHAPAHPVARLRRAVDAVGMGLVAIDRARLAALGGFDPAIADWAAALLHFCLTAQQHQARVLTEPAARAHWLELPDQPLWVRRNFGSPTPPMPQLRARWRQTLQQADAARRGLDRPYRAHLLLVGQPRIEALAGLDCRLSWLNPTQYHEEHRLTGIEAVESWEGLAPDLLWCLDPAQLAPLRAQWGEERVFGPDERARLQERLAG